PVLLYGKLLHLLVDQPLFFFRNVKLHLDISLSVFHFRAAFRYKGLGLSQQAFFANGYSFAVLAIYSIPPPKCGICCAFLLILDEKKDCSPYALQSPASHIVRLVLCLFDFRNFPCRCGYNPYAFIAHTVQQRVKLPPIGRFLSVAVRKEKLIYRNMIPRYKVIEHLQTRLLSLVLNIRKVARGN